MEVVKERKKDKRSYSEKLKDPRWQRRRLEIMDRDGFSCRYCYDTKSTLHVHHKSYNGDPWEADDDELITLCENCHSLQEGFKKDMPSIKEIIWKDNDKNMAFIRAIDSNNDDVVVCVILGYMGHKYYSWGVTATTMCLMLTKP